MTQPTTESTSTIYDIEVQFTAVPGIWAKFEITIKDALEVLKTGLYCNQPISKVKLFSVADEDDTPVCFVYDIAGAKSGTQPWSLTL